MALTPFIEKRQTFHILDTGPEHDQGRGHLHIILTNSCANESHLLVPVCSRRNGEDPACFLGEGDHPFIRRPSYISYFHAQIQKSDLISKKLRDGSITYRGFLDERVFALVCLGLIESRFVKPKIQKYFQENRVK